MVHQATRASEPKKRHVNWALTHRTREELLEKKFREQIDLLRVTTKSTISPGCLAVDFQSESVEAQVPKWPPRPCLQVGGQQDVG